MKALLKYQRDNILSPSFICGVLQEEILDLDIKESLKEYYFKSGMNDICSKPYNSVQFQKKFCELIE